MKTRTLTNNESPRILIVEDDKTLEPVWSFITKKADKRSHLEWATSELEAEDLIFEAMREGHQFDLIVVDIFLEGQRTGLDLYEKFGHLFHNKMIITSGTDYGNYAEYLSTGSNSPYCLEKPFLAEKCIEIVRKMLH